MSLVLFSMEISVKKSTGLIVFLRYFRLVLVLYRIYLKLKFSVIKIANKIKPIESRTLNQKPSDI